MDAAPPPPAHRTAREDSLDCASDSASEPTSPHPSKTAPSVTWDFDQVVRSKRFAYLADPLMRRGYSLQHSHRNVFLSLFALHNETINVWTHLLGGIVFAFLLYLWARELNSPGTLHDFLTGVHNSPPGLVVHFLHDKGTELQHEAQVAWLEAERYFEEFAKTSMLSASEFAKQLVDTIKEEPSRLAAHIMQLPDELQAQAQAAVTSWVEAETRMQSVASDVLSDASKMPQAFLQWMEHAAKDNPAKLVAFLSSLPSNVDTESKRAAASVRAWLESDKPLVEELLATLAQPSNVSSWPLLCFIFGAVMCLTSSAMYHWWVGYEQHTHDFMCRVDLGGISFMIWGSSVPLVYYTFYNDPAVRDAYLAVGSLLCAATLILAGLPTRILHTIKMTRVLSYIGAGGFVILPLVHAGLKWGWDSQEVRRYINDGGLVIVALLYVFGAVVYMSRFPESRFPGRFDFVGASHQIWHLMVVAAACVHYVGVVHLFSWRVERDAMALALQVSSSAAARQGGQVVNFSDCVV